MRGVDRVSIASERGGDHRFEFRVGGAKTGRDRLCLADRRVWRLERQRAPFELQRAGCGIRTQLAAALDDGRVQRSGTEQYVTRLPLQAAVERFERGQHAAHSEYCVAPVARPAAMRGAAA